MNDFIKKRKQEFDELHLHKDYTHVFFNELTGALQATHVDHNFDRSKGHYEKQVQQILYNDGNKVILESEKKAPGIRTPDSTLNDVLFDIKAVEGNGRNNIKHKLNEAISQGCEHLVLFFSDPALYNPETIAHGYIKYK